MIVFKFSLRFFLTYLLVTAFSLTQAKARQATFSTPTPGITISEVLLQDGTKEVSVNINAELPSDSDMITSPTVSLSKGQKMTLKIYLIHLTNYTYDQNYVTFSSNDNDSAILKPELHTGDYHWDHQPCESNSWSIANIPYYEDWLAQSEGNTSLRFEISATGNQQITPPDRRTLILQVPVSIQ